VEYYHTLFGKSSDTPFNFVWIGSHCELFFSLCSLLCCYYSRGVWHLGATFCDKSDMA